MKKPTLADALALDGFAAPTRPPQIRLYEDEGCIDGFAGGGGTSKGIEMAIGRGPDVAINHDRIALAMHEVNHPLTHHIRSNIRTVRYETALPGKRCGFAWFSPDCTHFSKAKGGRPFRDRQRARRIRGLAWEAVRCAKAIRPRILFLENVEEWLEWGPIGADNLPDPTRKGVSFRRWLRDLQALGYVVEWRELRACDFGAPTTRKRLFVIARCDGQPIVWPSPTHGPQRGLPHRTAAECIDFDLPVPSIFMTQTQARKWAKAMSVRTGQKVEAPHRPLARATLRRIARGVQRFVIDAPEPFIVSNMTNNVPRPVSDPLSTVLTGNHKFLVTPFLAKHCTGSVGSGLDTPLKTIVAAGVTQALVMPFLAPVTHTGRDDRRTHSLEEPMRTVTCAKGGEFALIAPSLVRVAHGERDRSGKKRGKGEHALTEPLPTQTGSNEFALMVPTLINTRNGERKGQAPRVLDIEKPMTTVTASGSQGALVAAFLAKHNGGHEATGQPLTKPTDTVVCRENKALVTGYLTKLYGTCQDGVPLDAPMPTVTGQGNHIAEVRAFLVKFYGTKKDGRPLTAPVDTITTKDRFALATVTIAGEEYAIVDIGMRMLAPRELFNAQGFPGDYQIDRVKIETPLGFEVEKALTKRDKTRLCGNSVPPHLAAAIISANLEVRA